MTPLCTGVGTIKGLLMVGEEPRGRRGSVRLDKEELE